MCLLFSSKKLAGNSSNQVQASTFQQAVPSLEARGTDNHLGERGDMTVSFHHLFSSHEVSLISVFVMTRRYNNMCEAVFNKIVLILMLIIPVMFICIMMPFCSPYKMIINLSDWPHGSLLPLLVSISVLSYL